MVRYYDRTEIEQGRLLEQDCRVVFVLNVGFTEMGEVRQTTDLNVIISYGYWNVGRRVRCHEWNIDIA